MPIVPDHCKNNRPGKRAQQAQLRQAKEEARRLRIEQRQREQEQRQREQEERRRQAALLPEQNRQAFRAGVSRMITKLLEQTRARLQDEIVAKSEVHKTVKDLWKDDKSWLEHGLPVLPVEERQQIIAEVWREILRPASAQKEVQHV